MLFSKKHKIGDTISQLRKEKGWTQAELASKLLVSDKAVSKWESNKGEPSIEFLPILAQLFDVSLDYLMMGKEKEDKIITISKLELCAKKDDVDMYKELKLYSDYKDENGKTIFDYVFKYESCNIFKVIMNSGNYISRHKDDNQFLENFYYMRIKCNDITVIRDLIRLDYINSTINHHLNDFEKYIGYNGSPLISVLRKVISDRIIELILYDKKTSPVIKEAMLSNHLEKQNNYYSPAISYPYLINYAVQKEDIKLSKFLLNKAIEINQNNANIEYYWGCYIGFVDIPKTTFDKMLEIENYELIELANNCNKIYKDKYLINSLYKNDAYILSDYEIEANKIKHNNKLSKKEKDLQLCIHNGIICLDELISLNDYDLYEKTLKKHVCSELEKIFNDIENKNYKSVFALASKNNINYLLINLRNKQEHLMKADFAFYIFKEAKLSQEINKNYLVKYINNNCSFKFHLSSPIHPENTRINNQVPSNLFILIKNYVPLLNVLDKDIRFIEKACKNTTQEELDAALTKIEPNNFKGIKILLDAGAKLHKTWTEDDGWGIVHKDEIDEIGTEILKKKINDLLGGK